MSEEAGAVEASSEVSDSTEVVESASPEVTEVSEGEVTESEEVSDQENEEVSAPELYDIVIDGETVQVPLDELQKGYQKASAANKRFQEAAEERKRAQQEAEQIKAWQQELLNNPFEALKNANVPFEHIRDHYENVVYQMLQMDQMSDEEKASHREKQESERMRKEYEQLKQQLAEKEEVEKSRAFEAEVEQQQEYWSEKIVGAIESGGLPATPEAVQHVARALANAADNNYELDIDTAVSIYKEESSSSLKGLLSQMDEDALMNLIGEERMNNVRKKDIERLKNPALPSQPLSAKAVPAEEREAASDFFDNLRKSTYRR